jgi:hypothetical protein
MKKHRLKNFLKYSILLFSICFLLFSCDKETIAKEETYFKTAPIEDVRNFLNQRKAQKNSSSKQNFITSVSSEINYENISNSDEQLAVVPVNTIYKHLKSRLTLLEVSGQLQSVVVSLNPFENSTDTNFYGELLISHMNGDFIKAFKIENNLFVSEYVNNTAQNKNIGAYSKSLTDETGGSCGCPFSVCEWCQLDEVVIESSSSPPSTPYVSITHMYPAGGGTQNNCEVGCDNNWDFGGGGNGTYNPPPLEEDPCDKMNSLESDRTFKDKLGELEENTSLDYETGFLLNHNGNAYDPISGNSGQDYIEFDVTGTIDGFIHSHFLPNGDSMFSPDDIQTLYFLFTNNHINNTNTFVMTVVTGLGTSYTIMIDNATAFSNFGLSNLNNLTNFTTFSNFYFDNYIHFSGPLVGLDDTTAREVAMLNALANSGLSLFRGNTGYDEWQKIEAQNNGTVNVDCN